MTRERSFWIGVTIALVVVIILLIQCKGNKPCPPQKDPERRTVYDTVPVLIADSTPWHRVEETTSQVLKEKLQNHQLIFDTAFLPKDSAIIDDYGLARFYSDTNYFKYGRVIVNNLVKNNRLGLQQVIPEFEIPEVTRTETIVIQPPQKTQLYIGIDGGWQMPTRLLSVGPSVLIRTKSNQLFEAGTKINTAGQITYEAGVKFPISLK